MYGEGDVNRLIALAGVVCIAAFVVPALADWQPGDPYKMHFPQLPDENGWDVKADAGLCLADDWLCTHNGPVDEIHFWGSWKGDNVGTIAPQGL
jgi:hypothetical protein